MLYKEGCLTAQVFEWTLYFHTSIFSLRLWWFFEYFLRLCQIFEKILKKINKSYLKNYIHLSVFNINLFFWLRRVGVTSISILKLKMVKGVGILPSFISFSKFTDHPYLLESKINFSDDFPAWSKIFLACLLLFVQ